MFAIIDIETTGNKHKYGKILEIAIYQHNGQEITGSFSTLLNQEMDIPFLKDWDTNTIKKHYAP